MNGQACLAHCQLHVRHLSLKGLRVASPLLRNGIRIRNTPFTRLQHNIVNIETVRRIEFYEVHRLYRTGQCRKSQLERTLSGRRHPMIIIQFDTLRSENPVIFSICHQMSARIDAYPIIRMIKGIHVEDGSRIVHDNLVNLQCIAGTYPKRRTLHHFFPLLASTQQEKNSTYEQCFCYFHGFGHYSYIISHKFNRFISNKRFILCIFNRR